MPVDLRTIGRPGAPGDGGVDTDSNGDLVIKSADGNVAITVSNGTATISNLDTTSSFSVPVYSDPVNASAAEGEVIFVDGTGTDPAGIYAHNGTSYVKAGNTDEAIQDIVSTLIVGGNNVSVTYDDVNGTLTIDTSALDAEQVQDEVNTLLTAGDNVNITYDDAGDSLTIAVPQAGAFADSDADNIGELVSALTGVQFDDGEVVEFGTNSDFDIRYNSATNDLRFRDKSTTTDRMALDKNGNLDIEGTFTEGSTL